MSGKFNTSCKKCIFAVYNGITQTDCLFHKLDLFRQYNVRVIEAYDEEKEFYVIHNRTCIWHRTDKWKYATESKEQKYEQILSEIRLKYQTIVIANDNLNDIQITINSLVKQEIPPQHISIIRTIDNIIKPNILADILKSTNLPWRLENIVNPKINSDNAIDLILDIKRYSYYAVFNAGCNIPQNTFSTLNNKMINELYPLTILTPNSRGDGLIVSSILHKIYQGNVEQNLLLKVKKDHNKLTPITEICLNFPK